MGRYSAVYSSKYLLISTILHRTGWIHVAMEFAKLTLLEGQHEPSDKLEGEVACFVKHQHDVLGIFCDGECVHVANINRIAEIL